MKAVHGVGFSPDGRRVYLSNEAGSTLDVAEQASGKVVARSPLSGRPNNLAVTPDGKRIVVAITEPAALDIVDAGTQKVSKSVPMR